MSIGLSMIKAILTDNITPSKIRDENIQSDKLLGEEKRVFDYISNHYQLYGRYPQLQTVEIECNVEENKIINCISEPFEFWAVEVRNRWKYNELVKLKDNIENNLSLLDLDNALRDINITQSTLTNDDLRATVKNIQDLYVEVMERHDRLQQLQEIIGIPFGIPFLDGVSGGIQKGDIVVIAGMTGLGKTSITLKFGQNAYNCGHKVLAVCTEMPELQVARRDLAMAIHLNSNDLKMGRVVGFDRPAINDLINSRSAIINGEDTNNYYKILPGGIYSNVEDIQIAVKELKPDLLVVDGAAIVRALKSKAGRWEGMIDVIESFKHMALKENIGIILTYHFGKEGKGKVTGIYGGQALSQFASMVLSFEYESEEDERNNSPVQYRILKLIKGRDGEKGTMRILFDMKRSIIEQDSVISGLQSEDLDGDHDPVVEDNESYLEI